jgi:hypothetical protein
MLREDIQALRRASVRDLRRFGLTVGGVFILLSFILFLPKWHRPWYGWLLVPGVPLVILGGVYPRVLKWLYVGWMTVAMLLGAIASTILLTVLFYLVVTPIGLVARLAGKDFLSQKPSSEASYWILRDASKPKQKHEHEQQF